jgi:hypothetical protein
VEGDSKKLDEIVDDQATEAERSEVLRDMTPISSPPTMYTINGVGTALYGRRNEHAPSGTHVGTLYFVVLFLPVVPLSCYRMRDAIGGGWHFIGKVPFSPREKIHAWAAAAALAIVLLSAFGEREASSDNYQPSPATYSPSSAYQATPSAAVQQLLQSAPASADPASSGDEASGTTVAQPSALNAGLDESNSPETASDKAGSYEYDQNSRRNRLKLWIEGRRERLHLTEADLVARGDRLRGLSREVEQLKEKVAEFDSYKTGDGMPPVIYGQYSYYLDRYNSFVDKYNALLGSYKVDAAGYERELAAVNESIDRYNSIR